MCGSPGPFTIGGANQPDGKLKMANAEGDRQRTEIIIPPLTEQQALIVAASMGSILNLVFMAYGESLGPSRIHEMEAFGQRLLTTIKNGEFNGLSMADEPAIIGAIHAFVAANIPQIKRTGDDNNQR